MDFFARQDRARAQTRTLVVLFALSVVAVVLSLTACITFIRLMSDFRSGAKTVSEWLVFNAPGMGATALIVLAVVFVGAGVKALQLQGGGAAVARSMGADRVEPDTTDPLKRRLVNVVEEMAIASGVPVPAVYVMDGERGVNAFAAGHTPADSAIAVTRGALETFDRDELQGVIGHEFSHILNGDMRLNMQLITMVAGLFAVAHAGRLLMQGNSRARKGGGLVLVGLAMFVLGLVGMLCGRMIQAAISRQREFLADASAVQFTRDPQGLRDALVKVGAGSTTSVLDSVHTDEVAHMLFASGLAGMFATHPPLEARIRALDPTFDPAEFAVVAAKLPAPAPAAPVRAGAASLAAAPVPANARISQRVGQPRPVHVRAAARLLAEAPDDALAGVHEPAGATLTLWALMLGEREVRPREREVLALALGEPAAAAAVDRHARVAALAVEQRLPLALRLLPALARLGPDERRRTLEVADRLARADGSISVSEYALARLLRVHLGEQVEGPRPAGRATLLQLEADVAVLFTALAHYGHADAAVAKVAFERGATKALSGRRLTYGVPEPWPAALDAALDRLDRLRPEDKARLVDALALVVAHDRTLDVAEAELLRAICGSLHCPLPPFVDEAARPTA